MNEFMSSYDRSPQGLKMICFWAKVQNLRYLRYSFWIENSSHSDKLKISLITKYPLTWGMQRRKVQLTLEEESFTGFSGLLHSQEGRTYQFFFIFPVLSPNYDFGIQMTKHASSFPQPDWTKVCLWPGLDESELVAFSINPLILTNRAARGF